MTRLDSDMSLCYNGVANQGTDRSLNMYVAIGSNAWGRGLSRAEALRNARKNLPTFCDKKAAQFNVYDTDDARCYVDERGRLISTSPVYEHKPAL